MTAATARILNPQALHLKKLAENFIEAGRDDDAITCLYRAITIEPDYAYAHLNLGEILLRRGEYLPGWSEFEWGSRMGLPAGIRIQAPQWNGMRLKHGHVILIGSQGYGDVVQFARYVPMVAALCSKVFVGCSPEMQSLMRGMDGVSGVFTHWKEAPPFAAFTPMTSLPRIFATTPQTIPAAVPYLAPPADLVEIWRARLEGKIGNDARVPKVGIAWAGRTDPPHDARRSTRLADWAPVLAAGGARFISLQKPLPEQDREMFRASGIVDFGADLTDFAQTAAVIANLDLVITVDTAVAHLAGAMGKPTFILLKQRADWRWGEDSSDSAWYPTARLFRQSRAGEWSDIFATIAGAVAERFQTS